METILLTVTKFISDSLLGGESIAPDRSLFRTQVLDSMSLAELIPFLEDQFRIRISPLEVAFENFDSVDKIVDFVNRKQTDGALG